MAIATRKHNTADKLVDFYACSLVGREQLMALQIVRRMRSCKAKTLDIADVLVTFARETPTKQDRIADYWASRAD